jgi:hypothetical protein
MEKLNFHINKPLRLHLHAIEGKERESNFGGVQHMFSAAEGVFYVSASAGGVITDQLRRLGVQPGDPVEICKAECDAGRGRKSVQWQVLVPGTTAAPGPVPVPAPAPQEAQQAAAARPQAVAARPAAQAATERPRWAEVLIAHTSVMIDAYAAVLRHASEQHGNAVRPDDCRNILTTMFINLSQKGGFSNAA